MTEGLNVLPCRSQRSLRKTPFHTWINPHGGVWSEFYRLEQRYLVRFPGYADFELSAADPIVDCHPAPEARPGTVEHLYFNQVRPLQISLQGGLVIHASAVRIGDGAVAFAGSSGAGKSTLAASFARSGHPFLTDDGLVVEVGEGACTVLPSHPSIRLWEDSERALIASEATRAAPPQYSIKSKILAGEGLVYCGQQQPLRRVYFLAEEAVETVEISRLSSSEAHIAWVKHSFLLDVESRQCLTSHFQQVAAVAGMNLSFRLNYPRRFDELAQVREVIVRHASESPAVG